MPFAFYLMLKLYYKFRKLKFYIFDALHPGRESNYKAKKEPWEQKPRSNENGTVFRLPKGGGGELPLEPETFMRSFRF